METKNTPQVVLWHGRSITENDPLLQSLFDSLHVTQIDRSMLDGASLTVAEATAMKQFASRSPHTSKNKVIVLTHIDALSVVVANALLKLIEEPPSFLLFRLNAERISAVLPTIRSRCQLVHISQATVSNDAFPLSTIDSMTLSDQLVLTEKLAKDETLPAIVTHWLAELEVDLLQGKPVDASIALGQVLQDRLRTNMNRRIALESWFISRFAARKIAQGGSNA